MWVWSTGRLALTVGYQSGWRNACPTLPLCSPQIQYGLTGEWCWASAVKNGCNKVHVYLCLCVKSRVENVPCSIQEEVKRPSKWYGWRWKPEIVTEDSEADIGIKMLMKTRRRKILKCVQKEVLKKMIPYSRT